MIVHEAANRVVRLRIGTEDCALRVPLLDDARLHVDRRSEQAALIIAGTENLTAHVLACDPSSGVLITRWIDEPVWTPEQTRRPQNIERIAALLRRLHRLPAPPQIRTLDLAALIQGYWRTLTAQRTPLPSEFSALQTTALAHLQHSSSTGRSLCHNDLHAGNIIGAGTTTRLLDWEYSGLGEPLFDLASYTQSNDLDEAQCALLLQAYGATADMLDQFAVERWLFDWVCVLWLAVSGARLNPSGAARFSQLVKRCTIPQ